MKNTLLVLSVVCVLLNTLTSVTSLQCYQCDNCAQVKEEYLITCGSNATTHTTTTTTTTTTIAPNTTVTTTVAPAVNTTNATRAALVYQASRIKRKTEDNCICQNGKCDCSGQYSVQSRADANTTTVSYVCVKNTVTVNGVSSVKRACAVKYNQTNVTCTTALFMENCSICAKDKCNGSITLRFSATVLFLSMLSYVF